MKSVEEFEKIVGVKTELFLKYCDKYKEYEARAKNKGLKFLLTFQKFYFFVTSKCYICELDGRKTELGLDRLDNSKGYTEFNVAGCCWDCNRMKSNMTMLEFSNYMKRINPNHRISKMFDIKPYFKLYGNKGLR